MHFPSRHIFYFLLILVIMMSSSSSTTCAIKRANAGASYAVRAARAKMMFLEWYTCRRESRRNPAVTSECPRCTQHEETADHVLQCSHQDARAYRRIALVKLGVDIKKAGTSGAVTNCILHGIWTWTHSQPRRPSTHPTVEAMALRQDEIGWDHLQRGRISKGWQMARTEDAVAPDPLWCTRVVKALWAYTYGSWRNRNETIHGRTKADRIRITRERLEAKVRHIYQNTAEHDLEVSRLLRGGLHNTLASKTEVLKLWIANVERVLAGAPYHRVKMRDIRQYWQRGEAVLQTAPVA